MHVMNMLSVSVMQVIHSL